METVAEHPTTTRSARRRYRHRRTAILKSKSQSVDIVREYPFLGKSSLGIIAEAHNEIAGGIEHHEIAFRADQHCILFHILDRLTSLEASLYQCVGVSSLGGCNYDFCSSSDCVASDQMQLSKCDNDMTGFQTLSRWEALPPYVPGAWNLQVQEFALEHSTPEKFHGDFSGSPPTEADGLELPTTVSHEHLQGDFRTMPMDAWAVLHARFSTERISASIWSEAETGEYVSGLIQAFHEQSSSISGLRVLRDGVEFAKARCPESNRPWLDKLYDEVKQAVHKQLRAHSDSNRKDQQWEDESQALWWFEGNLICYLCGTQECITSEAHACERRCREILKVADSGDEEADSYETH